MDSCKQLKQQPPVLLTPPSNVNNLTPQSDSHNFHFLILVRSLPEYYCYIPQYGLCIKSSKERTEFLRINELDLPSFRARTCYASCCYRVVVIIVIINNWGIPLHVCNSYIVEIFYISLLVSERSAININGFKLLNSTEE